MRTCSQITRALEDRKLAAQRTPRDFSSQPLTNGVDWSGLVIMLAIVTAAFVASAVAMKRRDVGA